ncbi:MAG: SOS response-associated peptidase [Acetobacteraceae bacterium]|nr:SOS response-associated peptidase [Acetobacteraceae bacterium]
MCGRYASLLPTEALRAVFRTVNPPPNSAPSWNMAPSRLAPVIRLHPETRARHLDLLRWGLLPHWAKEPRTTRQPINARSETAASTSMFRDAFARRHCLVPADAFYEWHGLDGAKQPWAIARADGAPLVFAGLWEGWRGADGSVIRSFAILTTAATDALRDLHERMPVILEEPDWPLWLGEGAGDAAALLRPSGAPLRRWMVSTAVNNVRHDSAALLDPVEE